MTLFEEELAIVPTAEELVVVLAPLKHVGQLQSRMKVVEAVAVVKASEAAVSNVVEITCGIAN